MATSLIERLPAAIARLEAKYGPDDPYVKDLKEQLRASISNVGKTPCEVFRAQVPRFTFPERSADKVKAAPKKRTKRQRVLPD